MLNNTFAGKENKPKIVQPSDNVHSRLSTKKNRLQQQPILHRTDFPNPSADFSSKQQLASSGFAIASQRQRNLSPLNCRKDFSLRLVN